MTLLLVRLFISHNGNRLKTPASLFLYLRTTAACPPARPAPRFPHPLSSGPLLTYTHTYIVNKSLYCQCNLPLCSAFGLCQLFTTKGDVAEVQVYDIYGSFEKLRGSKSNQLTCSINSVNPLWNPT